MDGTQNVSGIVNSPGYAAVAAQATQAGDLAVRQGLAVLKQEALRRENRIKESEAEAAVQGAGARRERKAAEAPPPRRRLGGAATGETTNNEPPTPGNGRIDLVA
jgi:hypothetical protein